MKRDNWKSLALMGLSSGLLTLNSASATENPLLIASGNHFSKSLASVSSKSSNTKSSTKDAEDPNDGNMNYHVMSEDELLLQLSPEGIEMYKKLDSKGKGLALLVASAMCNGTNACDGLNACRTEKNDCAGKGKCKGKGKCAFSDKNLAVKLVRDKMAAKRNQMTH